MSDAIKARVTAKWSEDRRQVLVDTDLAATSTALKTWTRVNGAKDEEEAAKEVSQELHLHLDLSSRYWSAMAWISLVLLISVTVPMSQGGRLHARQTVDDGDEA